MPVKSNFASGDVLTASDTNTYLTNGGLVYITEATIGSAVSSVTVSNCFSATYDNYFIVMSGGTGSTSASIGIALTGSSTGYYGFLTYGDSATNTVQGAGRSNQALLNWVGGVVTAGNTAHLSVQVLGPYKAAYTKFLMGAYQSGGNYGTMNGEHRVATSYTGFTVTPDAGTLTGGFIRVYGYRQA